MCVPPHPCAYLLVPSTLLHSSTTCNLSHYVYSYLNDSFNLLPLLQTYTMEGYGPDKGVSPRAVAELFNIVESSKSEWSYALTFSMLEIYNESILDLLDKSPIKVLHCVLLCCAVLCCAVLCCAVLYCTVLCCMMLCCTVLCCMMLCCMMLCCDVLYCTVLYCTVLCCAILHCAMLYYTVFSCAVM